MNKPTIVIPKSAFNTCYLPYIRSKNRYLVFYGGGGSGKSYFVVQRYIVKLMENALCNLLCVRQYAKDNKNSTFALLTQLMSKWSISHLFNVYKSELRIVCKQTGNEVIFAGLDDVEKLKSVTFKKGELTDVWIEEASEIKEADFNQLDIRLRGMGTSKQITISFNPIDINHWLKKRFIDRKAENITFLHTTYKDNAFLEDDYKALLESYKDTDFYYYQVYCLGEWGVYGKTIFDKIRVQERLVQLRGKVPLKRGYFHYISDGESLSNIKWKEDKEGCIEIFKDVKKGIPYVLAGDTAGEGSDFFTAQVLNNITGEQTAKLRQQFDEDLYADQIYCLGQYFNNALIGVESNYTMTPIKKLQDLKYPKLYIRQLAEDSITHNVIMKYGFNTNKVTRPVILAELVKVIRQSVHLINDVDTLDEMLTFVRNERGRAEAMEGSHDDLVMALAIAHYIRPQQSFEVIMPQGQKVEWHEDWWEDYYNGDEKMKEYLIKKRGNPF